MSKSVPFPAAMVDQKKEEDFAKINNDNQME
jgi:hypothetical protein